MDLPPEGSGGTAHLLAQSPGKRPRAPSGIRSSPLLPPPPSSHRQPLTHPRAGEAGIVGVNVPFTARKQDGKGLAGGNRDTDSKNKTYHSLSVFLHRRHFAQPSPRPMKEALVSQFMVRLRGMRQSVPARQLLRDELGFEPRVFCLWSFSACSFLSLPRM